MFQDKVRKYFIKRRILLVVLRITHYTPKVFFRYFYINTATGEKSADMYASAKLSV